MRAALSEGLRRVMNERPDMVARAAPLLGEVAGGQKRAGWELDAAQVIGVAFGSPALRQLIDQPNVVRVMR